MDIYLYVELSDLVYILIEILFLSLFTIFFGIIVISAYFQKGNLYYIGLSVFIIAYFFILLPFFNIYLPLFEEAPWGNTLRAETFYLGCLLLICGGGLLVSDAYFEGKRIVLNYWKLPEKTKQNVTNAFLFISGLCLVFNLWDYNGLIYPIYFGFSHAPEPLFLEKVPVMLQFTINSILIGIWLFIFIFYLYKKHFLAAWRVMFSILVIIILVFISAFLILNASSLGVDYTLLRYWISPLPSFIIILPLLIILKSVNQ
ncbi:MAG: hypothetical protein HWN66_18825 [Candidatus Helarchaeota archaeon]|nr:hypothetical protein [Candidatus Helarchaeota archaeon]